MHLDKATCSISFPASVHYSSLPHSQGSRKSALHRPDPPHPTHTPTQTPSAIPSLHKNLETPAPHSRSAALSSRTATAIAATKLLPDTTATPHSPHSPTQPTQLTKPCLGNTNTSLPSMAIPRRNMVVSGEQRSSKSRVKSWHRSRSGCG